MATPFSHEFSESIRTLLGDFVTIREFPLPLSRPLLKDGGGGVCGCGGCVCVSECGAGSTLYGNIFFHSAPLESSSR